MAEDEEIYTVEAILGWRYSIGLGVKEYYVKWSGYDINESTWEPEENLNCEDLLEIFRCHLEDDDRYFYDYEDPKQLNGLQRHAPLQDVVSLSERRSDSSSDIEIICICRFEDSHQLEQIPILDLMKHRPTDAFNFLRNRVIYRELPITNGYTNGH